jgi:hypothetical protein
MKLFCILVKSKAKKPYILTYTVIQDIPPVAKKITNGYYFFSGELYIIDMDYTSVPTDLQAGTFNLYKNLLLRRLKIDRIL